MKKVVAIVGILALAGGLVIGLGGSVFAQDGAEQIGDPAPEENPCMSMNCRGIIGTVISLEDGVLTLETRRGEVSVFLAEDTKYGIPVIGEVTAEEFAAYVDDALVNDDVVEVGVRAVKEDDDTLIALRVLILPIRVIGEVISLEDGLLTVETRDGEASVTLADDAMYGIPGTGQVTAEEFAAYIEEALADGKVVKVAVRATEADDDSLVALGARVINRQRIRRMRMSPRMRLRHMLMIRLGQQ